ncbi:MAG: hypothetical protein SNJ82_10975 [Gemmataceae bacterium]
MRKFILFAYDPTRQSVVIGPTLIRAESQAPRLLEHGGEAVRRKGMLSAIASRLGRLGRYESTLQVCLKIKDIDTSHHQAFFGAAYYLLNSSAVRVSSAG